MEGSTSAIIGACIGSAAAISGFLCKEAFDRRRQQRTAINTLRIMSGCLKQGLDSSPDQLTHTQLDKAINVVHDLATSADLIKAIFEYDAAMRSYRIAWVRNTAPTPMQRDEILRRLASVEAILDQYKDGGLSRLLNWVAGLSRS